MSTPASGARPGTGTPAPKQKKPSLLSLVTDVPGLVSDLIHREIALIKAEMIVKLKALGIGAGLIVGALIFVFAFLGVLLTAAILALSLVMPGWLAALLVAAVLLIVAVILGLLGYRSIMRGVPPIPTEAIDSLQRDYRAITGIGKRAQP